MTIFNLSAKNVHHVKILGTGRGQAGKKADLGTKRCGGGGGSEGEDKPNLLGENHRNHWGHRGNTAPSYLFT